MSSRDAVAYARSDFQKGCSASKVAGKLAKLAIKRHTAGARNLGMRWVSIPDAVVPCCNLVITLITYFLIMCWQMLHQVRGAA